MVLDHGCLKPAFLYCFFLYLLFSSFVFEFKLELGTLEKKGKKQMCKDLAPKVNTTIYQEIK